MEQKLRKYLTGPVIILVLVLVLNFILISFNFRDIPLEDVVRIEVINGLSGQKFTVEDPEAVGSLVKQCNGVTPLLWFGPRSAGYHYYLRFYNASGQEIASFTVISPGKVSMGSSVLLADCTVITEYLNQIS